MVWAVIHSQEVKSLTERKSKISNDIEIRYFLVIKGQNRQGLTLTYINPMLDNRNQFVNRWWHKAIHMGDTKKKNRRKYQNIERDITNERQIDDDENTMKL